MHFGDPKLSAERRIGEMLKETELNKGGRPSEKNPLHDERGLTELKDVGLNYAQSHRYQQIAEKFQRKLLKKKTTTSSKKTTMSTLKNTKTALTPIKTALTPIKTALTPLSMEKNKYNMHLPFDVRVLYFVAPLSSTPRHVLWGDLYSSMNATPPRRPRGGFYFMLKY
jgi:hypothetical protein